MRLFSNSGLSSTNSFVQKVAIVAGSALLFLLTWAVFEREPSFEAVSSGGFPSDQLPLEPRAAEPIPTSESETEKPWHAPCDLAEARNYSRIPKILHIVFGLKPDAHIPFSFVHHLAIKSAYIAIKPACVMFHYRHEPIGEWWNLTKPYVRLMPVRQLNTIFGKPIDHFAHKADVLRYEALLKYGGIYVDTDILVMKSFDHLLNNSFVMGKESFHPTEYGLCNAVLLSEPWAPFLVRWYQSYQTFDQSAWNYQSVIFPRKLADRYPSEITVLPGDAFFWPLWTKEGLKELYEKDEYNFKNNLAVHLWESKAYESFLKDLNYETLKTKKGAFYRAAREVVAKGDPWNITVS